MLIAHSHGRVGLTTRPRTLHLRFAAGARLVRGRYVSAVTATILGVRVRRARTFSLR